MGRLMRGELERFEMEKVEDFKSGIETYLESAVEAQKEVSFVIPCLLNRRANRPVCSLSRYGKHSSCSSIPRTVKLLSLQPVS